MSVPTIPAGWRKLLPHEVVKNGDKFWEYHEDGTGEWYGCSGSVGEMMRESFDEDEDVVITPTPTVPAPDKEWLNPWD